jgi:hypothetical protein
MESSQIQHVVYVICRDFYRSAQPYFGYVFISIVCLAIIIVLHKMYAKSLRESVRLFIDEFEAASQRRREPSSLNFLFAILLVIVFGFVLLSAETSNAVREFFFRETVEPTIALANIAMAILLGFFLVVFFIWSTSFSSKYRAD